jgi:hypothetical protein
MPGTGTDGAGGRVGGHAAGKELLYMVQMTQSLYAVYDDGGDEDGFE